MSTAIKSSFVDHSGLDGTGDAINGTEVDENPNVIAYVLDGTLATDLAGAGTIDFVMTDTRAGIRLIDLSNAAAAIHEGLVLEWDPGNGGNLTDNSSGIGIDFKLPDDADTQTVFGSLNVVCVDDAAASTDGEFSFRVTAAGTDNVEQMTLSAAAMVVTPPATITGLITATAGITSGANIVSDTDSTDDLGTSSVRWANLFVDSIGDTGQDLTIAATTTNLPSGHVIDYNGANVVLTHSAGVLNVSTGALQVGGTAVSTLSTGSANTWTADQTFNDNVKVTLGTGGDADLYYDGTNVVLNPKVVGSGIFSVSGEAKVSTGSSGGSAHPNVNEFIVEGSGASGIQILSGNGAGGSIFFGDDGSNTQGQITYDHGADNMLFATASTSRMTISSSGAVNIVGALSKGSGSFKIRHPLPEKAGYDLVHSFVEAPQADLIYRGTVDLVDGSATVNIDTAGRMTDGTFVALCTNVQSFTSNESNDDCVRGSVVGNTLTITSSNASSTASISWMVIGERKDQHMLDTSWTDEDGRVITEPLTEIISAAV